MKVHEVAGFAADSVRPIRPRHIADIRRTAAIRRTGGQAIISQHADATRQQFAEAYRREGGVLPVVIPCHNEADDLPGTLLALARSGNVLPVVVDNNSSDQTVQVALDMGAVLVEQHKGKKMAATQAGVAYASHELGARRVLFTDGDTLVLPTWGDTMDSTLTRLDGGQGAAIFGPSLAAFGKSKFADLAASGLNLMYKVMHERRGELPVAHGHNYGLSLDAEGAMEAEIMALHPDSFAWPGDEAPDDFLIRQAVHRAGAVVVGSHLLDMAVLTRNDRVDSVRQVVAMGRGDASYLDYAHDLYVQEYGTHVPAPRQPLSVEQAAHVQSV